MEPDGQHDPVDAEPGWTVANCTFGQPRLTFFGTAEVPPLSYCPALDGEYELYLCVKEELLECTLELPGQSAPEWVYLRAGVIPFNKFWKEIRIGRYQFHKNDWITNPPFGNQPLQCPAPIRGSVLSQTDSRCFGRTGAE